MSLVSGHVRKLSQHFFLKLLQEGLFVMIMVNVMPFHIGLEIITHAVRAIPFEKLVGVSDIRKKGKVLTFLSEKYQNIYMSNTIFTCPG